MTIHLASAPVSWGIYEFESIAPKYPYARVLDEIAETGYTGIELGPWGYLPTDPEALRPELAARGLRLLSSYVPVNFADPNTLEADEAFALQVGRLLASQGAVALVLADENGSIPALVQQAGRRTGSALSADEWDTYARGVNQVARRVFDETGLDIVFHHHCGGYVETAEETRQLMARTDADLIGLCLDTGHWEFANGGAVSATAADDSSTDADTPRGRAQDAIAEYGARVRYLHLKDCAPSLRQQAFEQNLDYFGAVALGVFCEMGRGGVDFPAVIAAMNATDYDGWAVVEQDVLVDDLDAPRQSSQRNRDYLRGLGL